MSDLLKVPWAVKRKKISVHLSGSTRSFVDLYDSTSLLLRDVDGFRKKRFSKG